MVKAKSKRPEPKAKALASGWKRHEGAEGSAQRAHPATSAGDAAGLSICQCASSCCWSCVRVSSCRGVLASSLTIATTQVCDSGSPWPAWCSAPLLPFSLLSPRESPAFSTAAAGQIPLLLGCRCFRQRAEGVSGTCCALYLDVDDGVVCNSGGALQEFVCALPQKPPRPPVPMAGPSTYFSEEEGNLQNGGSQASPQSGYASAENRSGPTSPVPAPMTLAPAEPAPHPHPNPALVPRFACSSAVGRIVETTPADVHGS